MKDINDINIKKIYISGRMTGIKDFNFPKFFEIETMLQSKGYETFNPAKFTQDYCKQVQCKPEDIDRIFLLKEDIENLLCCDAIYMIAGWEHSEGARAEWGNAVLLKYPIYYEERFKL
jgi:hypothetical protein